MSDPEFKTHLKWGDYFASDQAPIFVSHWSLDGEYPHHDHDFMEIVLCVGGQNQHTTVDGTEPFGRGDLYVLRPGVWHRIDGHRLNAWNCCFALPLLWRELAWTIDDVSLNGLLWSLPPSSTKTGLLHLKLSGGRLAQCISYLRALCELGNRHDPNLHARRIGLLTLLLGELGSELATQHKPAPPRQASHPAVLGAIRTLQARLGEPWNMTALAALLDIDASYLSRLFRRAAGLPPMAYLARLRAEKAASLLVRTEHTVGEIGVAVGWAEANYFARRFRAHFGLSASEYRRRCRREGAPEATSVAPVSP